MLGSVIGAYYWGQWQYIQGVDTQLNADQYQIYQAMVQNAQTQQNQPAIVNSNSSGTNFLTNALGSWHLDVTIYHKYDSTPRQNLLSEGFTPSCEVNCKGIYYFIDPTTLITNDGRDFEQCKVYGAAGTITCTSTDVATVMGWSASSTVPAATDTDASGPCSSTNEIIANGLTDVAGTVTAGAAGTTVTTTISKTFTLTGTESSVQTACLYTETNTGGNIIVFAESTFGPDSFVSGDSLQGTWQNSRT